MSNAELIAEARRLAKSVDLYSPREYQMIGALVEALEAAEAERDAALAESINESNWGTFASVVLEAESSHWQAEYESLTNKYGAYKATKTRAAWKLGATMLLRRAERYRQNDVRITIPIAGATK